MAIQQNSKFNTKQLLEYVRAFVILLVLFIGFKLWQSYDLIIIPVNNHQMSPMFMPGEFHCGYRYDDWSDITYDDVVYYEFPIQKGLKRREFLFIARVVGLPGDRISFQDGACLRNGKAIPDNFISQDNRSSETIPEMIVPRDHAYLLVDDRLHFQKELTYRDSRFWGPVLMHTIVGKILPK